MAAGEGAGGAAEMYRVPARCQTITREYDVREEMERGFAGLAGAGAGAGAALPGEPGALRRERRRRLQQFMNRGDNEVTDHQFLRLSKYCSDSQLRKPHDNKISLKQPFSGQFQNPDKIPDEALSLDIVKNLKLRLQQDPENKYSFYLKYKRRESAALAYERVPRSDDPPDLEPGKTILYRIRVYKPFLINNDTSEMLKLSNSRDPIFEQEIFVLGHQTLDLIRDNIKCLNDCGIRQDCSEDPSLAEKFEASPKEILPSGFLFINNKFYVDMRYPGSIDYSSNIRKWAEQNGIGKFEHHNIEKVRLDSLKLRLGFPEVYMHQGHCEHLFTFSEIRLLKPDDSCTSSSYPYRRQLDSSNSVNCMTCGNYMAKWIVTGSDRLTFDPAYMCGTCFQQYNYIDGVKVGTFKAYPCYDKSF